MDWKLAISASPGSRSGQSSQRSGEKVKSLKETRAADNEFYFNQIVGLFNGSNSSSNTGSVPTNNQVMIVLVGIPGSGKSTMAAKILSMSSSSGTTPEEEGSGRWAIANQDTLKSRSRVEQYTVEQLDLGRSVLVDRCNFDAKQRSHWIKIARSFRRYVHVFCVVLPLYNDIEVCSERAVCRRDDVHDPREDWAKIVLQMSRNFSPPSPREVRRLYETLSLRMSVSPHQYYHAQGFDGIIWLSEEDSDLFVDICASTY